MEATHVTEQLPEAIRDALLNLLLRVKQNFMFVDELEGQVLASDVLFPSERFLNLQVIDSVYFELEWIDYRVLHDGIVNFERGLTTQLISVANGVFCNHFKLLPHVVLLSREVYLCSDLVPPDMDYIFGKKLLSL